MPLKVQKRKVNVLTLQVKAEIIEKMEGGRSIPSLCQAYNVPRSILYDLRRDSAKVKQFKENFVDETKHKKQRKTMKKPTYPEIEEAAQKWWRQQRTAGVMVRGVDVKMAAEKFAQMKGVTGFKASNGWLARFKQRHGLSNKIAHGEAASADDTGVDEFREKLTKIVNDSQLSKSQIYNEESD